MRRRWTKQLASKITDGFELNIGWAWMLLVRKKAWEIRCWFIIMFTIKLHIHSFVCFLVNQAGNKKCKLRVYHHGRAYKQQLIHTCSNKWRIALGPKKPFKRSKPTHASLSKISIAPHAYWTTERSCFSSSMFHWVLIFPFKSVNVSDHFTPNTKSLLVWTWSVKKVSSGVALKMRISWIGWN